MSSLQSPSSTKRRTSGLEQSAPKRTRFAESADGRAEDGENTVGDLDIEEQDRKRNQQGRKGRVVTDGYDSDDDEESGDDDGEEEEKPSDDDAEDDEDMFKTDGGEGKGKDVKTDGKSKKFLHLNDIEGQEFSDHESEGDVEFKLESDEEEGSGNGANDDDETRQQNDPDAVVQPLKKAKKPPPRGDIQDMGYQMDSFHMKSEMATGRFDEEGNYIPNAKDPHAEHDKWLQGNYSRKSIRAAKDAKDRHQTQARQRELNREYADLDEDECKMQLTMLLRRNESVLAALQRLGQERKRRQGKQGGGENGRGDDDGAEAKRALDQVTSLSSELMSRFGRMLIYDATYESLLQDVRKSGLVRATWDPAAEHEKKTEGPPTGASTDGATWMYKWSPAYLQATGATTSDEEEFGPFSQKDLLAWNEAGFFGDAGERILLRLAQQEGGSKEWREWQHAFPSSSVV